MPRRLVDQRGRILVAKEKHATRYFDASTEAALYAAALKLLKERMHPSYGYIHAPGKASECYKAEDLLTDEQIAALPSAALQGSATRMRDAARRDKALYEEALIQWGEALVARQSKDGRAAWEILRARDGNEYERVRFEYLESA